MNGMNDTVIDNDTGEVTDIVQVEISGAVAAEISQQVATARRYPRRPDKAITTEIMGRATLDEETAAECVYTLPRAGKDIVGPSIRFAEIVFASYGNLRANARFVEIDTKDPLRAAVIIEGLCIDVQMNNAQGVPVRRSITGKKGVFGADMTNIAFAAGAAIARREAILKTVPKSVWGGAWKQVLAVLQGDVKTLAARRRSAIEAFSKMGVTPEKVFAELGVLSEDAISLEHMPRLIGMWTALRDGSETIESMFGRGAAGPQHETVNNPLKDEPGQSQGGTAETSARPSQAQQSTAQQQKPDPISSGPARTAERTETASNEGAKSDMAAGEAEKPAGETASKPSAEQPAAAKTVPAASLSQDRAYRDGDGYIEFIHDQFDAATSKAAVNDTWRATRTDRQELLTPEQVGELTKDKDAALRKFDIKGQLS